jgi:hypothetical protein
LNYNKKKGPRGARTETAEVKSLRSVAGYTNKGKTRNTNIREGMNIFNINNNFLKHR